MSIITRRAHDEYAQRAFAPRCRLQLEEPGKADGLGVWLAQKSLCEDAQDLAVANDDRDHRHEDIDGSEGAKGRGVGRSDGPRPSIEFFPRGLYAFSYHL